MPELAPLFFVSLFALDVVSAAALPAVSEDSPLTDALLCSAAAVPASPPAGAAEAAVSAPDAEAAVSSAAPLSVPAAEDAAVLLSAPVDSASASVVPEAAVSPAPADSLYSGHFI